MIHPPTITHGPPAACATKASARARRSAGSSGCAGHDATRSAWPCSWDQSWPSWHGDWYVHGYIRIYKYIWHMHMHTCVCLYIYIHNIGIHIYVNAIYNYIIYIYNAILYTLYTSPIEFQGRRCDPNSVCYKNYSQAWGYRMRLLSSIFSQNGLQQPWHRGNFPLLQNAPSFSTTAHIRTYPLLQNA